MSRQNFAGLYRPQRFEDVHGQTDAVNILSGLIKEGRVVRDLLLKGAYGSGKTTLARIYAKALNCREVDAGGSPCGTCDRCTATEERDFGLYEYDVPGRGGDLDSVEEFLKGIVETARGGLVRAIFFDEAHALEKKASDYLLKKIEEAPEDVAYMFATTEPSRIIPALRSRLFQLEVDPLSPAESVALLQDIASRANITYEWEALTLLAGIKNGYPRDLVVGLEQVTRGVDGILTLDRVRSFFGADHEETLAAYLNAVAEGNITAQLRTISDWRQPPTDRLRWIKAFLLSLYYNQILGLKLFVDPLVDSIQDVRPAIIKRFLLAFAAGDPSALILPWRSMLDFWTRAEGPISESELLLRLTLFHQHVSGLVENRVSLPQPTRSLASVLTATPEDQTDELEAEPDEYMNPAHVRGIINRASYLTQQFGVLFNTSFIVRPSSFDALDEAQARELVTSFLRDLERAQIGGEQGQFAAICLLDRDDGAVRGRIVAHCDPNIQTSELVAWASQWRAKDRMNESAVEIQRSVRKALKWHWDHVLELCKGLSPSATLPGPKAEFEEDLAQSLGLGTLRSAGPVAGGLVRLSQNLRRPTLNRLQDPRLAFLSAFDDGAWRWLRSGWEGHEWKDRMDEILARKTQVSDLDARYRSDEDARLKAQSDLEASWPVDPRRRTRSWRGWW